MEDEIREVMTRVCRACPVRGFCRRYASDSYASAGFWAGGFRGGAYTGDLLDLLAELDEQEVEDNYEPEARKARHVHARRWPHEHRHPRPGRSSNDAAASGWGVDDRAAAPVR